MNNRARVAECAEKKALAQSPSFGQRRAMETTTPLPPETPSGTGKGAPTKDERLWAMICHLCGFVGHVIPIGNIVAPLVVWALKKDELPFVADQGKEAINFQISWSIYMLIAGALCWVLIGFVILPVLWVLWLVFMIIASVKANEGVAYRYPMTFRLIS